MVEDIDKQRPRKTKSAIRNSVLNRLLKFVKQNDHAKEHIELILKIISRLENKENLMHLQEKLIVIHYPGMAKNTSRLIKITIYI